MEGVGARFGRSSTRYGPTTVFNGPVRKWKKKWIAVLPSNTNSQSNHSHSHSLNGSSNGTNGSHLRLYKWTPISYSINDDKNSSKDEPAEDALALDEPPRRKFKYVPIAVLEEEETDVDDENDTLEPTTENDGYNEKPDINDVPMEETQDNNRVVRQDLNESTLDLSLG